MSTSSHPSTSARETLPGADAADAAAAGPLRLASLDGVPVQRFIEQALGAPMPDLRIAAIDTDLNLVVANHAYREGLAEIYRVDVPLGADMRDLIARMPRRDLDVLELWKRALAGESVRSVMELGTPPRLYVLHFGGVFDASGTVIGAWQIARDVTDERRARQRRERLLVELEERVARRSEALQRSRASLETALDAGRLGVWDLDFESGQIWLDRTSRALLDLEPGSEPLALDDLFTRLAPTDIPRMRDVIEQARRDGHGRDGGLEVRVPLSDGSLRWLSVRGRVHGFPSHGAANDDAEHDTRTATAGASFMVGVARDITERKRSEQALRCADERKNHFLAMLGHELRSPLSAITNGLVLWKTLQPALEDPLHSLRGLIERQLTRLVEVADVLLDSARIARGKLHLELSEFDACALVREVIASSLSQDPDDVVLDVELPDLDSLPLVADRERVRQILVYVLRRVTHDAAAGATVQIQLAARDGGIEVAVIDESHERSTESLAAMFDDTSTAHLAGGTRRPALGLELELSRRIAALHGGRLSAAHTDSGAGTRLVLWLPEHPHVDVPQGVAR